MATETKSIKVSKEAHRRLKMEAARKGEHVYELVDRIIGLLYGPNRLMWTVEKAKKAKR